MGAVPRRRSLGIAGYKRAGDVIRPERLWTDFRTRGLAPVESPDLTRPNSIYPPTCIPVPANFMCDETWEREFAKRWKLLAAEDEMKWLPVIDGERVEERIEPAVLPTAPAMEEKKRASRLLVR